MAFLVFILIEVVLGFMSATTFSYLLCGILLLGNLALVIKGFSGEGVESLIFTIPPVYYAIGAAIGAIWVTDWVTVWVHLSPYLVR